MRLFLSLLLLFVSVSANSATLTFSNDFENNLNGFAPSLAGGSFTRSTARAFRGSGSGWFLLNYNPPNNYRAEATLAGETGKFQYGTEYWLSYKIYLENYQPDPVTESLLQIHVTPKDWNATCNIGGTQTIEPFVFINTNGTLQLKSYGNINRWTGPTPSNRWVNYVFHFRISFGADGYLQAWIDGNQVTNITGQNHGPDDGCGNTPPPPYLKLGLYKWPWKRSASSVTQRSIFIDDVRLATGPDGYDLVSGGTGGGGGGGGDTTAPVISAVSSSNVTNTSATINWTTNEASSSTINYGPTTSYGSNASASGNVTTHVVNLTGLNPGSLYHYRVNSTDASGNAAQSGDFTFNTVASGDTTLPIISNIIITTGQTDATVTWTTDELSNSRVQINSPVLLTRFDSALVTNHSLTFSSATNPSTALTPNVTYNAKVQSTDAASNQATVENQTIQTKPLQNPVITSLTTYDVGENAFTIGFDTDKPTSYVVSYGLTSAYGSTASNATFTLNHNAIISSLTLGTDYHYKVCVKDASNLETCTEDRVQRTSVLTMEISSEVVTADACGLTFTWVSSVPASGCVNYGTNINVAGKSCETGELSTAHSRVLSGLSCNTLYYIYAESQDDQAVIGRSGLHRVKTLGTSGLHSDSFD